MPLWQMMLNGSGEAWAAFAFIVLFAAFVAVAVLYFLDNF